jgi:broad specificity phosphatase PhoE
MFMRLNQTGILLLLLGLFCQACQTTHYFLVRHAEKRDSSPDTPLSEVGWDRALSLRNQLIGKRIDAIFSSNYSRTRQTAQPLADALSTPLSIYQPDTTGSLAAVLKKMNGKNVLVVGHSNTIPPLVAGLSGETVAIADNDYDNLFVVRVRKTLLGQKVDLTKTTYGKPSP